LLARTHWSKVFSRRLALLLGLGHASKLLAKAPERTSMDSAIIVTSGTTKSVSPFSFFIFGRTLMKQLLVCGREDGYRQAKS